jgi:hypothetical protein
MNRTHLYGLLFLGCGGGALFSITVRESAETVVEKGTLLEDVVGQVGFGDLLNLDITSSQELQNQGVAPGDIQQVYLSDFVLTATDPPGSDLAFLESVEVFVSAPDLPEVIIASASGFPEGVSEVAFDLEDVDLTDYAISASMNLRTDVTGRRPDVDTTLIADVALDVGVTAQGVCNNL